MSENTSSKYICCFTNIRTIVTSVILCDFDSIRLYINSMEQGLRKANSWLAGEEVFHPLWNPKIHFRFHKTPPPAPILGQVNLVQIRISFLFKTRFNIILPFTPKFATSLFCWRYLTKVRVWICIWHLRHVFRLARLDLRLGLPRMWSLVMWYARQSHKTVILITTAFRTSNPILSVFVHPNFWWKKKQGMKFLIKKLSNLPLLPLSYFYMFSLAP
jgi:hypothetical protein